MSNSPDKIARINSIFTLCILLVSLLFSIFQFYLTNTEKLSIITHLINSEIKLTSCNFGEEGKVIQFPWQLVVSNTGNKKISIVDYDVVEVLDSSNIETSIRTNTCMDGGLFDLTGHQVEFPLVLGDGESKKMNLMVGILIDSSIFDLLSEQSEQNEPHLLRNDELILARHNVDFFGNPLEFTEYDSSTYVITTSQDIDSYSPILRLRFETSRNKFFTFIKELNEFN